MTKRKRNGGRLFRSNGVRALGRVKPLKLFTGFLLACFMPFAALASEPLALSGSAYIRMHADDPVRWRVWSQDVLDEAKHTGKPVFLTIGFFSCHWCHVMQKESFRDPATAKLINEGFVPVIVDREERPDLDQSYQIAAARLGAQTGWPLNVFLDHKGRPFFAGSYFPGEAKLGMPAFRDVLAKVSHAWSSERGAVAAVSKDVAGIVARGQASAGTLNGALLDSAAHALTDQVDVFDGGFGSGSRHPNLPQLEFLWRRAVATDHEGMREASLVTLRAMIRGGIYDHVGGGFFRYAVDPAWRHPHFEKMLHTSAGMIRLLTMAWRQTRDEEFRQAVLRTAHFLTTVMQLETGGFAASLDADTGGREGASYRWTLEQLASELAPHGELFLNAFALHALDDEDEDGVLYRTGQSLESLAEMDGTSTDEVRRQLTWSVGQLARARAKRESPGRDDKLVTDWNALTAAALAEAGATFGRPEWVEAARAAFNRILPPGADPGAVRHIVGESTNGMHFLGDYGALLRAALTLFEVTGEPRFRAVSKQLAVAAMARFGHADTGGFAMTPPWTDAPFPVPADLDGEIPSGTGLFVEGLSRLFYLDGDPALAARAERAARSVAAAAAADPFPYASILSGFDTLLAAVQIVLIGRRGETSADGLVNAVWQAPVPGRVLQVIAPGTELPEGHPARFKDQIDGRATAYVCRGSLCSLPVTDAEDLKSVIGEMVRLKAPN